MITGAYMAGIMGKKGKKSANAHTSFPLLFIQ
jgi:hypothetical protein